MAFKFNSGEESKKVIGGLRKSQAITTFGVGSIVDMKDFPVIMAATDYWDTNFRINEPSLQKLLNVKYFKEPKVNSEKTDILGEDLPAFRFPRMYFCPESKKLMDYKKFGDVYVTKCQEHNKKLIPSRFVVACSKGHLEDFPYKWWVHNGDYSKCPAKDKYDKLTIEYSSASGGLSSIKIKCSACGAERTMEGCMNKEKLKGYRCRGSRPWVGFKKEDYDPLKCDEPMQTLQRGASNVYFGVLQSALTIPPWSNAESVQMLIEDKWENLEVMLKANVDETTLKILIKSLFVDTLNKGVLKVEDFLKEIAKKSSNTGYEKEGLTEFKLFEGEYKALCIPYSGSSDEKFKTEETKVPNSFKDYFSSIILAKRLREVLALKGFRRIMPEKKEVNEEEKEGIKGEIDVLENYDYTKVFNEKLDWLPAIEMLGEGIFIRFNEEKVKKWEERMEKRYKSMKKSLGVENIGRHKFSPRYVMLHTFSHLLIRELVSQCGYSESALKERIYSTYPGSNTDMAGVLIYTSSSDSDGSMGGLVRQGEAEVLNNTILNLLQDATWCSSDPLCIESMEQGYNSLNYAACHACTLLPETSCEARNCLLDRVAIVGKMEDRDMGYFGAKLKG